MCATAGGLLGLEDTGGGPTLPLTLLEALVSCGELNDGILYTLSWLLFGAVEFIELASMEKERPRTLFISCSWNENGVSVGGSSIV